MKKRFRNKLKHFFNYCVFIWFVNLKFMHNKYRNRNKSFWNNVQFGGGLGLGLVMDILILWLRQVLFITLIEYVSAGLGVQYNYVKQRDLYKANMYGGSVVALFNPIEELQISTELEQLRVNRTFNDSFGSDSQDFWNTALFVGAGYRNENVTIGIRYNVLIKTETKIYTMKRLCLL